MDDDRSLTDVALVRRAREGDDEAFGMLARRYYRYVYVIALSVLGRRADAEDATQDTFARVARRLDQFRDNGQFRSWIGAIARNISRDYRDRVQNRTEPLENEDALPGPVDIARDQERADLREVLEDALKRLGEVHRQVVLLHDLEGLRHREIGEQLGISDGMSRQRLFEARRILRELLRGYLTREREP